MKHDSKRGKVKDNALKALVTSPTYRPKVERDKTKYKRKQKHKKPANTRAF